MQRSRQLAVILAIVAVLGLAFYALRPKHTKRYQGKSLTQWMLEGPVPVEAVEAIGVASIPELIEFVGAEPSMPAQAIDSLDRKGEWGRSRPGINVLKGRASEVFDTLGTNGAPAVPYLLEIMKQNRRNDPYSAATAAHCLAAVGESGVRELVNALSHTNWRTRHAAAFGLSHLGRRVDDPHWKGAVALAVSAVPMLLNQITNHSRGFVGVCFGPLQVLHKEIPWVVPSLVGLLQHTNVKSSPALLREALSTIAAFGPQAEHATNAVAQFLSHPDPTVAAQATKTLRSLQARHTNKDSGGNTD